MGKKKNEATTEEVVQEYEGIVVGDPLLLRPVELPLVVKPSDEEAGWSNPEQAEYAAILNAYAYKNPANWAVKKDILIKQLIEIGKNPTALAAIKGEQGGTNLSYKNRLIEA